MAYSKTIQIFALSVIMLLCIQCKNDIKNDNAVAKEEIAVETASNSIATKEAKNIKATNTNTTVYAWVDNVNIRDRPSLTGSVVYIAQPKDELTLTGNRSDSRETIVLRGVAYDDVWVEIKNTKEQVGWVFGGAIKKEDEEKGNLPVSDTNVDFEYFGKYNVLNWKKEKATNSAAGDATITETRYTHPTDPRTMVITHTDVGDYGYTITHELLGMNDRPLNTHTIAVSTDVGLITETNITHNRYPKRKSTREQQLDVAHFKNNGKIYMALGDWEYSEIEK